jgi:hypothetical protein
MSFPTYQEAALAYQSIGALGLLAVSLALRMSMYRLAGSPGENVVNSPLNRAYEAQQLTAEWTPLGICLILANLLKVTPETQGFLNIAAVTFCVCRYIFTARYFLPTGVANSIRQVSILAMTTCYFAAFALVALLFCPV